MRFLNNGPIGHGTHIVTDAGVQVAVMYGERINPDAAEHTALFLAAPELLSIAERWAALDHGAWNVGRYAAEKHELLEATQAAITKATGAA